MLHEARRWLVCGLLLGGGWTGAGAADQVAVPVRRASFLQEAGVVNERANLLRSQADEAYQRGEYKRVVDICNQLLQQFKDDNPHVAYHLRARDRKSVV